MADRLLFSYASADDPALKRIAIQTIERLTGQPRLKRLYLENQRRPRLGESFWDAAVRHLELRVDYDREQLQAIPAAGPVVVVANHPFGVVDGLVIGHLLSKVRPDLKMLTHSLLCRALELQPYLLPIDFAGTPAARATNLRSRAEAFCWLCAGGALVVFPGGAVSTSDGPFARRAIDPEWKLFTAKAITHARATVVPIFLPARTAGCFRSRATSA
jgi:putative hemolysin